MMFLQIQVCRHWIGGGSEHRRMIDGHGLPTINGYPHRQLNLLIEVHLNLQTRDRRGTAPSARRVAIAATKLN